jgi:carbonic anhydrase/acetyltransferase-like protein (isoleucine patch superfamily)
MIIAARGKSPQVGEGVFVAPSAALLGDVRIGRGSSIWFNTTLRGDVMPIIIGDETNIQDNTVVHGTFNKCGATIGHRVTVGHSVVLHGCTIGDLVLVGMGSIVMDQAKIGSRCIVAAGSLVTEDAEFAEGQLILGRPAKAVRPLHAKELAFLSQSAQNYMDYMKWYAKE